VELVLVRHGLPVRLEVADGPADPPLSDVGRRQADALARWLSAEPVDVLVTSPLRRARETAAPLEAALGLTARIVDDVAEWDRHSNVYLPTETLRDEAPDIWDALAGGDWEALGIDLPAFLQRVVHALDGLAAAHPGQRVVVVCHGGVINAYAARVLGLEQVLFFDPHYTGFSRILVSRSGRRGVRSLNEAPHLRELDRDADDGSRRREPPNA
jgi:broad specificity phosphatase PhoE